MFQEDLLRKFFLLLHLTLLLALSLLLNRPFLLLLDCTVHLFLLGWRFQHFSHFKACLVESLLSDFDFAEGFEH